MSALVALIKPLVFSLMNSCEVKKMVADLIDKYAKTTDNDIDDVIAATVRGALLRDC